MNKKDYNQAISDVVEELDTMIISERRKLNKVGFFDKLFDNYDYEAIESCLRVLDSIKLQIKRMKK